MTTLDFTPLFRSRIGLDRLPSLLDTTSRTGQDLGGYPPYNIEVLEENRYELTLAVAGFDRSELDIQVEDGVLTVKGETSEVSGERKFLHRGIANRKFERRFNLADHVEVVNAELKNGLLTVDLVREIPEAMKPQRIAIKGGEEVLEHAGDDSEAA